MTTNARSAPQDYSRRNPRERLNFLILFMLALGKPRNSIPTLLILRTLAIRGLTLFALFFAAPLAAAPFASDRIKVTVEGRGPDVILVHGLSSNARIWNATVRAVPGYRYHLVQVRGFGGEPNRGNTTDPVVVPIADELARYIAEQRLKAPALVGHSMGGTIGMTLAARHPTALGRLMIVDMVPFMGQFYGGPAATVASVKPIADRIYAGMQDKSPQSEAILVHTINTMINTQSERAGVLAESRASDQNLSARAYRELVVTDLRPELAKIAVPTRILYIAPKGLPITPEQMDGFYRAAYANLRGATLQRIDDSAHFIMFDQPARFQAELKTFLAAK